AFLDLGNAQGFLRRSGPLPGVGRALISTIRREPLGGKGADVFDKPALRLPMATFLLGESSVKPGPLGEEPVDETLVEKLAGDGAVGLVDPRPLALRLLMTLLDSSVTDIAVTRAETKNNLAPFLPEDMPVDVMPASEAAEMLDEGEDAGLARHHVLPGGGSLTIDETEALFAVDLDLGSQGGQSKRGAATKLLGQALGTLGQLGPVMGLGGQIIIDIPRGAIAAPKIVRDQITRALKPLGRVSVPAVTPEGIAVVIVPRSRPSLMETLTESTGDKLPRRRFRADHLAATALRTAERALENNRTGRPRLFVTQRVIPLLADTSAGRQDLDARFGPRLTVATMDEGDPRGDIHVEA
ncbi:MAG: ribonuclease E/G, partial [Pseudomonadota bacterium]